jgi:hypothetical protein
MFEGVIGALLVWWCVVGGSRTRFAMCANAFGAALDFFTLILGMGLLLSAIR